MENKKRNEEVQSRRDFFKKAAQRTLPILGAIVLSSNPVLAKVMNNNPDEELETGCDWGCTNSCSGSCGRSCSYGCSGSCAGSCSGSCKGACSRSCSYNCSGSCRGYCSSNEPGDGDI